MGGLYRIPIFPPFDQSSRIPPRRSCPAARATPMMQPVKVPWKSSTPTIKCIRMERNGRYDWQIIPRLPSISERYPTCTALPGPVPARVGVRQGCAKAFWLPSQSSNLASEPALAIAWPVPPFPTPRTPRARVARARELPRGRRLTNNCWNQARPTAPPCHPIQGWHVDTPSPCQARRIVGSDQSGQAPHILHRRSYELTLIAAYLLNS